MSLALAIKKNAEPLGQAQTTYKENVAIVNTFVNAVLTSQLPTLSSPPPDWEQFITLYEEADQDALRWVNGVMGRLLDVPEEVIGYNTTITQLLADAQGQAQALVASPSDAGALAALEAALQSLTRQLALVTSFISGAVKAVENFGDVLPEMSTKLNQLAEKSIKDAGVDEGKIAAINAKIEELREEIKSLTAALVGLGIADGVALTLGVAITIAAWPVGAIAWFVLGPVVVVATVCIAIDSEKIIADKDEIKAEQEAMSGPESDVAALKILSGHYAAMVAETETIEASLRAVLQAWQSLESDVATAVSDIGAAASDANSKAFQAVENDLGGAIAEWNAAYSAAGALELDLQVNPAPLELGMSSAEVQAKLAGSSSMGIIEYFNQVAAA